MPSTIYLPPSPSSLHPTNKYEKNLFNHLYIRLAPDVQYLNPGTNELMKVYK